MAEVGIHPVRLYDSDGDALDDDSGRLNVNAYLNATPTIDIGDVSLLLGGTAADTGIGSYGAQTLRVTLAGDDIVGNLIISNIQDCEALLTTINSATNNLTALGSSTISIGTSWTSGYGQTRGAYLMGVLRTDALANPGISVADDDMTLLQVDSIGGLYVTGSEVENAAVQSEPLLVGGRYDSSARTLGSGDAGAVALNASGHVIVDGSSVTQPVSGTVSVNSHAVTNAGTFAVQAGHDITGLASDDNDTVGTSAEKISGADGDVACKRIDIMAHPSNTGEIWVGDSAVTTNGGNGGIRLLAGDFYSMDIDNTGDVYVVATVDGENVCFNYYT